MTPDVQNVTTTGAAIVVDNDGLHFGRGERRRQLSGVRIIHDVRTAD